MNIEDTAEAEFAVAEPTPEPPKLGMRDRLKRMMAGEAIIDAPEAPKPRRKKDAAAAEFVENVTPLLALLIVAGANGLLKDPYKPVAPNREEASGMMRPVCRMLARRLDVAGKISADTLDLIAVLVAVGLYAERATATYRAIAAQEALNGPRTPDSDQTAHPDGGQPAHGHPDGKGQKPALRAVGGAHRQVRAGQPDQHAGAAADPISDILAADAVGRSIAGLNG